MSNQNRQSGSAKLADTILAALRPWQRFLPIGLAFAVPQILRAENRVDYRYGYYDEDGDRMKIETHSVYFEQSLTDALAVKGELVYDSVSGATPTGTHDWHMQALGQPFIMGKAKMTTIEPDLRLAGNVALDYRLGSHVLTPGFAYSNEHDYESYGVSLSDAIEFNEKNTILQLGVSHNFDSVRHGKKSHYVWSGKDSTEGIVGLTQLLSPKDVLTATFTFGNDSGYLSDPYRFAEYYVSFPGFGSFGIAVPEKRPSHRNKEVLFTSLTHHFDSLNASLEGSYRFYHDSYGVFSHTVGLSWHQWLGKHIIVEPLLRFSEQSAADFYSTLVHGTSMTGPTSGYYSSDYRLSNFYSLDYGLQATVIITDWARLTLGYHRYEMNGLDNTSADMYPKANIFTAGVSFSW